MPTILEKYWREIGRGVGQGDVEKEGQQLHRRPYDEKLKGKGVSPNVVLNLHCARFVPGERLRCVGSQPAVVHCHSFMLIFPLRPVKTGVKHAMVRVIYISIPPVNRSRSSHALDPSWK